MRRYARILFVTAFALVACAAAVAQKKTQPSKKETQAEIAPLKDDASLEETLAWLNDTLLRYGKFTRELPMKYPAPEPSGQGIRYRFLGLEAQGCTVTYRVRQSYIGPSGGSSIGVSGGGPPSQDGAREKSSNGGIIYGSRGPKPASGANPDVVERTVDLTALDPSLVVGITQKKRKGGAVSFIAAGGKMSVRGVNWFGKPVEYDGDELFVGETERVEPLVNALRRAVTLCRK
jgi:hypothetical protein